MKAFKAFKPCPRSVAVRLGGMTASGLLGLLLFLAGGRASAQSSPGEPAAVKEDTEAPPRATLGAPRAGDQPADSRTDPGALPPPIVLPETDMPSAQIPKSRGTTRKPLVQRVVGAVAAQNPMPGPAGSAEPRAGRPVEGRDPFPPTIRLELPGTQVLFRLESELELLHRMRQEAMQRDEGKKLYFPDTNIVLTPEKSPLPRRWQPLAELVEPADVGFRRLWFHQINFDRYGWDLGIFQPAVSTGVFYFDILTLPLQFAVEPCRRYEYNTGWCLPGDPAPLALYPPMPK
jgi:hypothetical protein